jgi:tetratricopeptide (TPR) repeat protein
MAERGDEPEAEALEGLAPGNPAAVALALGRRGKEVDAEAAAFLRDQRALIADQRHHLKVQLRHLGLRYFADRLRVGLQIFVALGATAVGLFVASLIWQAATDKGLVIEAFSVPPDLAQRGLTGEVIASQIEDKLSALQAATESSRAPASYSNDWGHEIKVEIPETGVSISELQRYLRQWLGHETHIGGEVFHAQDGLRLTVRAGGDQGDSVAGPEGDFDQILEKGAEALFARTQPYRWGVYLKENGRPAEAKAVYERLARDGSKTERPWGVLGLARLAPTATEELALDRQAVGLNPNLGLGWYNVWSDEWELGHAEAELQAIRTTARVLQRPDRGGSTQLTVDTGTVYGRQFTDELLGDYQDANVQSERLLALPNFYGSQTTGRYDRSRTLALDHDIAGAEALLPAGLDDAQIEAATAKYLVRPPRMTIAMARGDWPTVLQGARGFEAVLNALADASSVGVSLTYARPIEAIALAHMGQGADAQALAASLPGDCYDCVRARGVVAALGGRPAEADRWFAEAVRQGPSLPGAHLDWARAKLDRGDVAGAIAEARLAHQKGPHFADALELWGEALMRQGDDAGAAGKFAEAAKYAPHWARNQQMLLQAQAMQKKASR